jgi:CRP-like cAMP-binding protein
VIGTTFGHNLARHRREGGTANPRIASRIAAEPCMIAVLSRDRLVRIILEQTTLGAKILVELVFMLAQRLRQTSSKLLAHMDRQRT